MDEQTWKETIANLDETWLEAEKHRAAMNYSYAALVVAYTAEDAAVDRAAADEAERLQHEASEAYEAARQAWLDALGRHGALISEATERLWPGLRAHRERRDRGGP